MSEGSLSAAPGAATTDGGARVVLGPASDVERLVTLARTLAERNAQLQEALESRIVIEQAKGVLSERLSIGTDEAFLLLRRAARNHRLRIHKLASRVVAGRKTPDEITELLP